ncbi:Metal-dependent hydrolase, endonuclease/exonuclease/phosphatase family [Microbacterium hydrocarbonoxydans]|uniref:Metal-dependent hydrolase, endonuclease/exonuclease/phosphatase family n=2 Tax=Microbacterium hydrocarbonoxydans TaxID=273678 RepID=A0A1H4MBQ3_9MICO|nr:Metal-dependent hydrolase, endonuclease/exonuclease/phosphatase family [Microbacterium hydrocarbonoxydans]
MSFNLRRAMDGRLLPRRERWSVRSPAVGAVLHTELPTVLGLQEALPRSVRVVMDALGPQQRVIGHGRGRAGRGEGTPLVYDAERLDMEFWEQRALSDHPDVPGSRTWGNLIPRTLVRAGFRDTATGQRFVVINTHLDPFSARSRRRSAEAIARLTAASELPVIVLGDFNADLGATSLRPLFAAGAVSDSWVSAQRRLTPEWGSFVGGHGPRLRGRRIDGVLTTRDVSVRAIGLNTRTMDGIRPSDHLPVQALVRLPEEGA